MTMNEAFLHAVWKYRLLARQDFTGTQGEAIRILSAGEHNPDSGPDFFNARVMIDGLLMAGNVEIHVHTSDWLRHRHQHDAAYNNLVLHVVYEHDANLGQNQQFRVPVLELKPLVSGSLIAAYRQLEASKLTIPCGRSMASVPAIHLRAWFDRLGVSRLERKASYIRHLFAYTGNDYAETLHIVLLRNFGFKINHEAFELLAKSLPYTLLRRYSDDPLRLEALLFGAAGLLDEPMQDHYPQLLQNEFEVLRHKHRLIPLAPEIWKFSKTRPVNFPTIRLSQLASLIGRNGSLYHLLEEQPTVERLRRFFSVDTHPYWHSHFKFDVSSTTSPKPFGETAFQSIVINTIVPFLFFRHAGEGNDSGRTYALDLLSALPPEENRKTRLFSALGILAQNALESQAQTELYDGFCSKKACLRCQVAEHLLKASA